MRIVSLIASATEMVAALGKAGQLVGISHECDWPPDAVRGLPVLTAPKMDVRKKSPDIHRDVEKIVSLGLSVYTLDIQKLREVHPDIIITQDQCEVCAVTYNDVVQATRQCLATEARIVTLHPDSLQDIFSDIQKVAKALQVESRGKQFVQAIKEKMESINLKTKEISKKPRVVCLEWLNPLMVAGNWIPEMVEMAGGINGITQKGDHTKIVDWKTMQTFDPDILLLMPCGFTIDQTLQNRADIESLPHFRDLKAVRDGKVFVIDGNTYMNRPGPRIVESLYILAGLLHPEKFSGLLPKGGVKPLTYGHL